MNEKERRGAPLSTPRAGQISDERAAAWPPDLLAEFSTRECRHLVFLRWLYRQGRLTEWYRA